VAQNRRIGSGDSRKGQGSSYRRPGARLLLSDQNHYAGTISGGCLEAEVVRKAAWLIREGAVVERYSTEFDDTAEIPFGLAAAESSISCWNPPVRLNARRS